MIILAGGAALRMQQPKMLLPFGDKRLLDILLDETWKLPSSVTYLVTGCHHQLIEEQIAGNVKLVYNAQWPDGMASSIKKGLETVLLQQPEAKYLIIAVSDQPFLNVTLLQQLISEQKATGKGIVAAVYNDTKGTPVLFTEKYFDILPGLTGDMGAKTILKAFSDDVATVPFPEGAMDIDTPEDYQTVLSAYLASKC